MIGCLLPPLISLQITFFLAFSASKKCSRSGFSASRSFFDDVAQHSAEPTPPSYCGRPPRRGEFRSRAFRRPRPRRQSRARPGRRRRPNAGLRDGTPHRNLLSAKRPRRPAVSPGTRMRIPSILSPQRAVGLLHRDGSKIHRRRPEKTGDKAIGRLVVELERLADLLHQPVAHHDHAVAQGHRLDLVVGHVDRGSAEPVVQFFELDPHLHPQFGVKVRQRLVEQEHLRMAHTIARPSATRWRWPPES